MKSIKQQEEELFAEWAKSKGQTPDEFLTNGGLLLKGEFFLTAPDKEGKYSWYRHSADEEINYGIRPLPDACVMLCSINDDDLFSKLDDEICINNDRSGMYPFGFDFLGGNNYPYGNWNNTNTIRAMLNGQLAQYIEEEVLRPILNHKLLQKIEYLTP